MPIKDPEKRKEYLREYHKKWYAKNREIHIAKVRERKHTAYAGTCLNCGGPTVGRSKNDSPEYCGKPECKSVQRKGKKGE